VALTLAVEHPEVVSRLALLEPGLYLRKHPTRELRAVTFKTLLLGLLGRKRAAASAFMRAMLARADGTNGFDQLDASQREVVLANAGALLAELRAGVGEALSDEHLRELACPVTDLVGEQSAPFIVATTDREAALLPQVRLVRVPGGTHLLPQERPAQFARLLNEALGEPRLLARA